MCASLDEHFVCCSMAPNLLGNIMLGNSADPVQIISKPVEYHDRTISQPQPRIVKVTETRKPSQSTGPKYKWEIVWRNVIAFIYLHTFGLYGLYLLFNGCQLKTVYWGKITFYLISFDRLMTRWSTRFKLVGSKGLARVLRVTVDYFSSYLMWIHYSCYNLNQ